MSIVLSKRVDKFVPKNKWIASLSNGETIFDDNRPNMPPAWERLAQYVKENNLYITNLRLDIDGVHVDLPSNQEGYIHKKKIEATPGNTICYLCIGYCKDGKAMIHQLGDNKMSTTIYCDDPGEPWTIYKESKNATSNTK